MNRVEEILRRHDLIQDGENPNGAGQYVIDCLDTACRKQRKLYVNAVEDSDKFGMYQCKVCGLSGNMYQFEAMFAPPDPMQTLYRDAHEIFVRALIGNEHAMRSLEDRGFYEEQVVDFGYGYAGRDWIVELQQRGYTEQELIDAHLLVLNKDKTTYRPAWWNHIIIPYQRNGQYKSFQGRSLDPDAKPRYLNLEGAGTAQIYHPEDLYKTGRVWLTEGAFKRDALKACGDNATAILGTNNFSAFIDDLRACSDLWIVLDADRNGAGQEAAMKIARLVESCHVLTLPLPDDEEVEKVGVDDFLAEFGIDGLDNIAYRAVHYKLGEPQKTRHLASLVESWAAAAEKVTGTLGYRINHPRLMRWTDGIQRGALYALVGSPHMGKTTLELDLADQLYCLNESLRVDIWSNDDALKMIFAKFISRMSRLDQSDVRKPLVAFADDERKMRRWKDAVEKLKARSDRLQILDRSFKPYLEEQYEELCRWREANPDDDRVVFFDGFSKTDVKAEIRDFDMVAVYRSSLMKKIAQEADIPVITTMEVPKLYGKRPSSWDLRGSGQLEYDMDVILTLYTEAIVKTIDETKLKTNVPDGLGGTAIVPITEVGLVKDKMNGGHGVDLMKFIKDEARYVELNEQDQAFFLPEVYAEPPGKGRNNRS